MSPYCFLSTPVGTVRLVAGAEGLLTLSWGERDVAVGDPVDPTLLRACEELASYFAGTLRTFTVKVDLSRASDFSRRVYAALVAVPYGTTITYGDLAARAGQPRAARAVGAIMAGNPLPIILPCHRVIAANGALTGYSGGTGIATKKFLLAHEGAP